MVDPSSNPHSPRPLSGGRAWLLYALAWLPAVALYALATTIQVGKSPSETFPLAIIVMGTAALLGVGVWHLTGRVPWRDRPSARFYAVHTLAALVYSFLYTVAPWIPDLFRLGFGKTARYFVKFPYLGWGVLTGLWLYLLVVGISYSIRIRRRLREEHLAATQAQALAAQARLAALRAQVNPHFLFNALHSLAALIRHDPVRAEEAVERLGALLRYALDGGQEDTVTLAEEWRFVEDYLALERLRLGDRLRVEARLEQPALDADIPSFVLQPLVENAIRHGLAPRVEGGVIRIVGRVDNGVVTLDVSDNGGGPAAAATPGRGLAVLPQRLEVRYGPRASLETAAPPEGGFRVTVRLPLEDPE